MTNDGHYFHSGVRFAYRNLPSLSKLLPLGGPEHGGTRLTISGSGFLGSIEPVCRFNSSITAAIVVHDREVECLTPQRPAGATAVEFSMTGAGQGSQFTSGNLTYYFHSPLHLESLQPRHGPVSGGVAVTIRGNLQALPGLSCKFAGHVVPASFTSNALIRCIAPPHDEEMVPVRVGINSSNFGAWLTFAYISEPIVSVVAPSIGPQAGGDMVQLQGSGFRNTLGLACLFGDSSGRAHYISDNVINCTTPPVPAEMPLAIRVTNDGSRLMPATNVTFMFTVNPVVASIVPSLGPALGGINISVLGKHLVAGSFCDFGSNGSSTPANWINSNLVMCIPPEHLSLGEHLLTLRSPGRTVTGAVFSVVLPPDPQHISPMLGPAAGGTTVSVDGQNFNSFSICEFVFDTSYIQVVTTMIDSSQVQCISPQLPHEHTRKVVAVRIGTSVLPPGGDASYGSVLFRYHERCSITSVAPTSGPLSGGTRIQIRGSNFIEVAPTVKFGAISVAGVTIDSFTVRVIHALALL